MADYDTLQLLMKGAQAAAPLGQGMSERSAAGYNANLFRAQRGAVLSSAANEETLRRLEGRSVIAQQVANQAVNGAGPDSSQADVIRQNEVNLIADALAIRHRAAIEATGYESRARMAEYEGDQALYGGLQGAGAQLLLSATERRTAGARRGLRVS